MKRGVFTRVAALRRRTKAIVAIIGTAAIAIAGFGIAPSLAGWTRTEYANGPVSSLDCTSGSSFTTNGWAQEIAGQVAGVSLDPSLAGVSGISVQSGTPHSTVTNGLGASGLSYLGSDAWDSALAAGALDSISLGASLTLPLSQNTGAETEFARATRAGVATGASGAITTAGGGLVSLQTPSSSAPGVGSIDLDSALSASLGQQLGASAGNLADVSLNVGALGSETTLDSCDSLWQGMTDAASVVRSYVLAKLGLGFDSPLVGTTVTDATTAVTGLTGVLNLLQPAGTSVTATSVLSALTTAINTTTSPLFALSQTGTPVVSLGITFNPATAESVLTSTTTVGPVSIDLATGTITVDLAQLSGLSSLNSQPANTKLLSSAALSTLIGDIDSAISTAITSTLKTAIVNTLDSASVTAVVNTQIALAGINAADLTITIAGTAGQFINPAANGEPTVSTVTADLSSPALNLLLGALNLNTVLGTIVGNLVSPLLADLVPALASAVVSPVLATAGTDVASAISTLNTTTLAPVYTAFGAVVTVLGEAVEVTINAQPDAPTGSVGSPEPATSGEFFESALQVGVLNLGSDTSTLSLFLGSSAVGPDTEN